MVVPAKLIDTSSDAFCDRKITVNDNGFVDVVMNSLSVLAKGAYSQVSPISTFPRLVENQGFSEVASDVTSGVLELGKSNEIISDECIEFCEAQNVTDAFNCCMQKVKAVFKSAKMIQAELCCFYDDEEFDNESHVEIEVTINTTWEIAERYYDEWINWYVRSVPDSVRKFFILTINRE